jgi:Glycosyl hydrolases family 31
MPPLVINQPIVSSDCSINSFGARSAGPPALRWFAAAVVALTFVSFLPMRNYLPRVLALTLLAPRVSGQTPQAADAGCLALAVSTNVHWWAGVIQDGFQMPLTEGYTVDVRGNNHENQVQPLLLSSQGDVIWSEDPFKIHFLHGNLLVESKEGQITRHKEGSSLRDAFLYASRKFFPPSGNAPDRLLFSSPQYNTWIELMYDQNQAGILNYAKGIKEHGFPGGVLMIDDNWQEDYGKWDFHKGRFSDPKAMIATLHANGFKVMLWVCPFISPDCDVCRDLARQNLLLKDNSGQPTIVRWWNGASALLDFTDPKAVDWFRSRLDHLVTSYHVDGFKFDGGDSSFYREISTTQPVGPNAHTALYGKIGLHYPLNEYRAMWKMGGQPLGERLSDKAHSWTDLSKLIPDMMLEGLMGYPFSCPDMIGGGEFTSFLPGRTIDQELIVRSAQCQALMPMMQFSVAPWRILDQGHLKAVLKAVKVREEHKSYILELVKQAALTGEPVVRSMEYAFPHRGYDRVNDQFMLGDQILVAPVLEKGASKRDVIFPKGAWKGFDGKLYQGSATVSVAVPYDELCFAQRVRTTAAALASPSNSRSDERAERDPYLGTTPADP